MSTSDSPATTPYIGAMLRVVSNWVRDQVFDGVARDGFDDLQPSHIAMFRYPGLDGTRASDLASQLQISKQAINQLAAHLEDRGYIRRAPDPDDGRARVIRLTETGRQVERAVIRHARATEERIAGMLGADGFRQLRSQLGTLFQQVSPFEPDEPSRHAIDSETFGLRGDQP